MQIFHLITWHKLWIQPGYTSYHQWKSDASTDMESFNLDTKIDGNTTVDSDDHNILNSNSSQALLSPDDIRQSIPRNIQVLRRKGI